MALLTLLNIMVSVMLSFQIMVQVFMRLFLKKKDITVNLIASKSRFASMKKTTIPAWKSFIE